MKNIIIYLSLFIAPLSYASAEEISARLEANALTCAAEAVLGDYKTYYGNIENILYLQHLDEHPEIVPPNEFWRVALEIFILDRLMHRCVELDWIDVSEIPNYRCLLNQ
jgi:hypothetical protein